jgi:putative FmdB family regulatory protein
MREGVKKLPNYEYRCPQCESIGEVFHSMNESPSYLCPQCEVEMKKVFTAFNIGQGKRLVQQKIADKLKHEQEMKQEMKEEYGVESFQPIAAQSMKEVYDDVKASGSFVRERMQAETERTESKRKVKSKDWMSKAMRRAPERSREKVERKKADAFNKRTISI